MKETGIELKLTNRLALDAIWVVKVADDLPVEMTCARGALGASHHACQLMKRFVGTGCR